MIEDCKLFSRIVQGKITQKNEFQNISYLLVREGDNHIKSHSNKEFQTQIKIMSGILKTL